MGGFSAILDMKLTKNIKGVIGKKKENKKGKKKRHMDFRGAKHEHTYVTPAWKFLPSFSTTESTVTKQTITCNHRIRSHTQH